MVTEEKSLRFERMKEALAKSAYDSGKMNVDEIWPIHPLQAYPYFIDVFIISLNTKVELLRKEAIKLNPSRIWGWIINILLGSKMVYFKKETLVNLVNKLLCLLEESMCGNCFCEDGTHRIINPKNHEIEGIFFTDGEKDEILRLHAELMCYNQTLYWVANCAFREIHGPYTVVFNNQPAQLVVREFFKLNSPMMKLPFNYIKTESIYDKDINFTFFVLNDYLWDKQIEDHMLGYRCYSDGREITSTTELHEINLALNKNNKAETRRIILLSRNEKILGLAERLYKTINDIGEPVQVPIKIMEERIKTLKPEIPKRRLDRETAKMLFDPRE